MHKTIISFARTAFFIMLLLVPSLAMADKQAWVEYQEGTATLTFHYDENKETATATAKYDLNSGSSWPEWVDAKNPKKTVTTVVFDSCFIDARPTTTACWFYTFTKLNTIKGIENLNTDSVTNMKSMFYRCTSLTELDLSHFNTSNVTTMENMFYGLKLTSLDLSSFNTSKVATMKNMFYYCENLTSLNVKSFNTKNTTEMHGMFKGCKSLVELDLTSFDVSNAGDGLGHAFYNCVKLRNIMVTDAFYAPCWKSQDDPWTIDRYSVDMFKGAVSLPNYNSECTYSIIARDMSGGGCLNNVSNPSSAWVEYQDSIGTLTFHYDRFRPYTKAAATYDLNKDDSIPDWQGKLIAKVVFCKEMKDFTPTNCYCWFAGMRTLRTIENLDFLNTSNVTSMAYMFYACTELVSLDLRNFNTAKVTNFTQMFKYCGSLKNIMAGENFTVASGAASAEMFNTCISLPNYDGTKIDASMAKDVTMGGYLNISYVTPKAWVEYQDSTRTLTFHYDNQRFLTTATGIYDFDGDNYNSYENWRETDPVKVVFREEFCEVLPQYCNRWFFNKRNLAEIEGLENLNTSELKDVSEMFMSCDSLTSLDLTHFVTDSLLDTRWMFKSCSNLKNIYVSEDFSLPNLLRGEDMFTGCSSLPNYDGNATTSDKANYTDGYLTLRRQFSVGDKDYNVDGYGDNAQCDADVDFTDGNAFMSWFDFKLADGKKASYTRTMANKWGTLCLPFEINADAADCNFYTINAINADTLTLTQQSGTIAAGTPVIISKKSNDQSGITISTAAAKIVYMPVVAESNTYLDGAFEPTYLADGKGYFIANNKFYKVSDYTIEDSTCVKVNPYRAYIMTEEASSAKYASVLNIMTDDEATTSVSSVIDALNADEEYYDINGRRIECLRKGLNIVKRGNKAIKVIIK